MMIVTVTCPYCDKPAIYGDGKWSCRPCKAWVRAYSSSPTHRPEGRLAKERLRGMRLNARKSFERLWRTDFNYRGWPRQRARDAAYSWLAQEMGIDHRDCHIGFFDEVKTQIVIDICSAVGAKKKAA